MAVENLKLLIVLFCEVQFSACHTAEDRESYDVSGLFSGMLRHLTVIMEEIF